MSQFTQPRRRSRRRAAALLTLLVPVMSLQLLTAPDGHASDPTGTPAVTTQKMSGPSLNTKRIGYYYTTQHLSLKCYARGQAVTGAYSKYIAGSFDNLWYKVSDDHFVADVDLNTGSNYPVTGPCSGSDGRKVGSTRSYNAGFSGQCTDGAYRKFHDYSGRYPALSGNAKDWYNSARSTGWSTSLDAQDDSIVVFQPGVQGASSAGHVGWVDEVSKHSDGLYIHIVEMNYGGAEGAWHARWVKDVVGMSYILAPAYR